MSEKAKSLVKPQRDELAPDTVIPTAEEARFKYLSTRKVMPARKKNAILEALDSGATDRMAAHCGGYTLQEFEYIMQLGMTGHVAYEGFVELVLAAKGKNKLELMRNLKERAKNENVSFELYMKLTDEDYREALRQERDSAVRATPPGSVNVQINTHFPVDVKAD